MTLQTIWHLTLYTYAIFSTLFGAYIVVMSLKGARDRNNGLHPLEWILGVPWIIIGHFLDFVANALLSVYFKDLPHERTVTARLKRYRTEKEWENTRQRKTANQWCRILSGYDPDGSHC